ncbi:MAG: chorismate lyase [Lonepinella koalarum]|nr:chorismate lyase [Lonepinella koalarum]
MLNDYRRILSQNLWKTDRTFLTENLADWLLTEDSLTAKLEQCYAKFTVSVLAEKWTDKDEWLREVILWGDGKALVFAQTYFSANLMSAYGNDILRLNQTPLGYWLFAKNPQRIQTQWQQDPMSNLYARRSHFQIDNADVIISELFLAEFDFPLPKEME